MTLKETVERSKKWYLEKYGCLDWHWFDEGLSFSVGDYFGSMGEFSESDRKYARENGFGDELAWIEFEFFNP